jgi:multimeric flavodoxin WrbA
MARLLVVHHSPSSSMQALLEQVVAGANDDTIEGVEVVVRPALEATADDLLGADGYVLGTTANFGYMSGALKHFFDSTFLAVGGSLDPSDLTGAERSVQSIVGALGWKQSYDVLGVLGDVDDAALESAYELGATIAALLTV